MCLINNTFPLNTLEKKKTHNTMLLSVERLHLLATNHGTADSSALLSVYLCSTLSNSLKNFLKEDKVTYLLCAELADPNHLMRQVKLRSLKMYDSNGYTLWCMYIKRITSTLMLKVSTLHLMDFLISWLLGYSTDLFVYAVSEKRLAHKNACIITIV